MMKSGPKGYCAIANGLRSCRFGRVESKQSAAALVHATPSISQATIASNSDHIGTLSLS